MASRHGFSQTMHEHRARVRVVKLANACHVLNALMVCKDVWGRRTSRTAIVTAVVWRESAQGCKVCKYWYA